MTEWLRAVRDKTNKYANKRRRARKHEVQVGDQILIAQQKTTTRYPFDPRPYNVTKVAKDQVTARVSTQLKGQKT